MDIGKKMRAIGARVATLRGSRKQEDVALKAGIARKIVSNIENGHNYTMKNFLKVLAVLGSDIDDVFNIDDIVKENREIHRRVNEIFMSGDEELAAFERLVNYFYQEHLSRKRPG